LAIPHPPCFRLW